MLQISMSKKAKGQRNQVAEQPEPLASILTFGALAKRSNAADCKSVNGGPSTVLGFEFLTHRQISSPVKAGISAKSERTAEAIRIRKFSIRLLAVKLNRRFYSDVSHCRTECRKFGKRGDR
jgi:hypothetical protein